MTEPGPQQLPQQTTAAPEDPEPPTPRYEVAQLPPDDRGRQPWAVIDWTAGRWVEAGGEVDIYPIKDGARACIRRLRYLNAAGIRIH
ncbi:hypothetical protein [Kitasatospora sp. P5_F3]